MSVTVIAGAIGQWPLGLASDRVDRRAVIAGACLCASLAGIGMLLFNESWDRGILIFSFAFGLFALPMYALCVAHTNDYVPPTDYVEAASGLLLVFAFGAVIGPMIASPVMSLLGPGGLFAYTAVCHALLAGFALLRIRLRKRAPAAERAVFTEAVVSAQTVSPFDTRVEPQDSEGVTVVMSDAERPPETAGKAAP
jgi:MFS family permease